MIWHHIPASELRQASQWMLGHLLLQALPGSPARADVEREIADRHRRWSW